MQLANFVLNFVGKYSLKATEATTLFILKQWHMQNKTTLGFEISFLEILLLESVSATEATITFHCSLKLVNKYMPLYTSYVPLVFW